MRHKYFRDKSFKRRLIFADACNIPEACWASLVSWAHFGPPDSEFSGCFSQFCRPEQAPYAYCGKCDGYFDESDTADELIVVTV